MVDYIFHKVHAVHSTKKVVCSTIGLECLKEILQFLKKFELASKQSFSIIVSKKYILNNLIMSSRFQTPKQMFSVIYLWLTEVKYQNIKTF